MSENGVVLEARQLVKSSAQVEALRGASFEVRRNEVVALVGDHGRAS
jgi:ABC-type sugar transport system ATPase subunit